MYHRPAVAIDIIVSYCGCVKYWALHLFTMNCQYTTATFSKIWLTNGLDLTSPVRSVHGDILSDFTSEKTFYVCIYHAIRNDSLYWSALYGESTTLPIYSFLWYTPVDLAIMIITYVRTMISNVDWSIFIRWETNCTINIWPSPPPSGC